MNNNNNNTNDVLHFCNEEKGPATILVISAASELPNKNLSFYLWSQVFIHVNKLRIPLC